MVLILCTLIIQYTQSTLIGSKDNNINMYKIIYHTLHNICKQMQFYHSLSMLGVLTSLGNLF